MVQSAKCRERYEPLPRELVWRLRIAAAVVAVCLALTVVMTVR